VLRPSRSEGMACEGKPHGGAVMVEMIVFILFIILVGLIYVAILNSMMQGS
jgi:hypothetical protein